MKATKIKSFINLLKIQVRNRFYIKIVILFLFILYFSNVIFGQDFFTAKYYGYDRRRNPDTFSYILYETHNFCFFNDTAIEYSIRSDSLYYKFTDTTIIPKSTIDNKTDVLDNFNKYRFSLNQKLSFNNSCTSNKYRIVGKRNYLFNGQRVSVLAFDKQNPPADGEYRYYFNSKIGILAGFSPSWKTFHILEMKNSNFDWNKGIVKEQLLNDSTFFPVPAEVYIYKDIYRNIIEKISSFSEQEKYSEIHSELFFASFGKIYINDLIINYLYANNDEFLKGVPIKFYIAMGFDKSKTTQQLFLIGENYLYELYRDANNGQILKVNEILKDSMILHNSNWDLYFCNDKFDSKVKYIMGQYDSIDANIYWFISYISILEMELKNIEFKAVLPNMEQPKPNR